MPLQSKIFQVITSSPSSMCRPTSHKCPSVNRFCIWLHLTMHWTYRTASGLLLELFMWGSGLFRVRYGVVDRLGFSS